jgi:hypothetical protein
MGFGLGPLCFETVGVKPFPENKLEFKSAGKFTDYCHGPAREPVGIVKIFNEKYQI